MKSGIDKDFVEEPLNKLKVRIEKDHPELKFKLKSVTISQVKKSLKKMKNKKSIGIDGLTQEKLKLGVQALAAPLTDIINDSIKTGKFPDVWKESLVTPVLKKGTKN